MTPKQIDACVDAYLAAIGKPISRQDAAAMVDQAIFLLEAQRRGGRLTELGREYRRRRLAGETRIPFSVFWAEWVRDEISRAASTKFSD